MYDTCDEALASDGPTRLYSPLTALTASSPPLSEIVKYGLLIALGRKAIFSPSLIWPPPAAAASVLAGAGVDSVDVSSLVEPQALTPSRPAMANAARPALFVMDMALLTG